MALGDRARDDGRSAVNDRRTGENSRLAIDGGTPVRSAPLPYARQTITDADIAAVTAVLRSDWLTTGPCVAEFETALAAQVGARHVVAFSSGTAALHAAAFAAGIGPGDEAITTPLTFVATANCVRYLGGDPVFVDIEPDTLNLDIAAVAAAITPRTKAILPVDFSGQPVDLDELMTLAASHGCVVIEDAAHSLGATYRGRKVGAIADMTVFSTHPAKHITTGEGGAVATERDDFAERLRRFRTHGIASDPHQRARDGQWTYEMVDLGFNYRITDIQCALGTSQLASLGTRVIRRQQIAERYSAALGTHPAFEIPTVRPDRESSWHLYVLRVREGALRGGRAEFFRALHAENINVNVHYVPVPWHPYYASLGHRRGGWPHAEGAYERMVSLPMFSGMSDEDVEDVIAAVEKVAAGLRSDSVRSEEA